VSLRIITFKSIGYENQSLLLQKTIENCCDWPLYVIWFIKDNNLLQIFRSSSSSHIHEFFSSVAICLIITGNYNEVSFHYIITSHTEASWQRLFISFQRANRKKWYIYSLLTLVIFFTHPREVIRVSYIYLLL